MAEEARPYRADGSEHAAVTGPARSVASARGLEVRDLDEQRMAAFLADRQVAGAPRVLGSRAMNPLLAYLRQIGAAPPPAMSVAPLDFWLSSTGRGW